ncbi:MAG TPA: STAS domain-containing protein [Acidimicrobiales bacterium]|nr:STAS domain-containing protein [Acidimicrobiales bacterium]
MAIVEGDQFSLVLTRTLGTVVVAVSGEVDAAGSESLRTRLDDVIDDESPLSLVVDLQELTFMDSTGLGVLVHALKRMRERGGDLTLSAPSPATRKLLDISGLDRIFPVSRV